MTNDQLPPSANNQQPTTSGQPPATSDSNISAGKDVNVGRDLTARDRIEIHAESGSTVVFNQHSSSTSNPSTSPGPINQQSTISNHQSSPNPFFTSGRIPDPHLFFGRERLVREIKTELSKRSSLSLAGASQIGKSSLLYYLYVTRAAWLPEVTIEYVDLQRILDERDFCETVLRHLGEMGDSLRDLKRVLENRSVILFFDEVERLAEPDFNPRLHDLLRSLSQEKEKLALCLATQRPLEEVFPARASSGVSPFHNIFTRKTLGPFTEAEARDFLAARLSGTGIVFDATEVERLWVESLGHPAQLQRLAKELFEGKASTDTQRISG